MDVIWSPPAKRSISDVRVHLYFRTQHHSLYTHARKSHVYIYSHSAYVNWCALCVLVCAMRAVSKCIAEITKCRTDMLMHNLTLQEHTV